MRKKIVRDEIDKSVNRNSKTNRKHERISENHHKNRNERKHERKNIICFKRAFARDVMRFVNAPKNAVKQPSVNAV